MEVVWLLQDYDVITFKNVGIQAIIASVASIGDTYDASSIPLCLNSFVVFDLCYVIIIDLTGYSVKQLNYVCICYGLWHMTY